MNVKWIIAAACAVALAPAARAGQASKVDVTGKWIFTVETSAGSGTPTVTLKQDGDKLTGHYSSETLGEADLQGEVKGSQVKFAFNASAQGASLTVVYTGTVEAKDSMKGSVDLGGMASGSFTAKRQ